MGRPAMKADSMEFHMLFAQPSLFPVHPAAAQGKVIALKPLRHAASGRAGGAAPRAISRAPRPLRVIVNRAADGSCQLMASGRLADVCAELNRLSLA